MIDNLELGILLVGAIVLIIALLNKRDDDRKSEVTVNKEETH